MNPFAWRQEHKVAIILGAILGAVILEVIGFMYAALTLGRYRLNCFGLRVPLGGRSSAH
jgi:hypothetical protein